MAQYSGHSSPSLTLNLAPLTFRSSELSIGRVAFKGDEEYEKLRLDNSATHAFRFDQRDGCVANVPIHAGYSPLGEQSTESIDDHLFLVGKALLHTLRLWLSKKCRILRRGKPLQFCGASEEACLLSNAFRQEGLEPDPELEVFLRYTLDTRILGLRDDGTGGKLFLVLDYATSNVIDVPASRLLEADYDITDHYVVSHPPHEGAFVPKPELLGRVLKVEADQLLLTDTQSVDRILATKAYLEARQTNLDAVVHALHPRNADRLLNRLRTIRSQFLDPSAKLAHIRTRMEQLQGHLKVGEITADLGPLLSQPDTRFPTLIATDRPGFLFGAQGRNSDSVPDAGLRRWGPYRFSQHEKNEPTVLFLCQRQHRGRVEQFAHSLINGFSDDAWEVTQQGRQRRTSNPYRGGLIGKFRLTGLHQEWAILNDDSADAYRAGVRNALQSLPDRPDLAVVQTQSSFRQLNDADNPYFAAKAELMSAGIPVQAVTLEKIEASDRERPYILNSIALASYAKLGGTPWVITTQAPVTHELIFGLGYTEVRTERLGDRQRYVGITTVFQGDGQYLVWDQTREVEYDDYETALLNTVSGVVRMIRQRNGWQPGDRVRLIFHVFKRLKDKEVEVIRTVVQQLLDDEFAVEHAFIDISAFHQYHLFDSNAPGVQYRSPRGFRGLKGKHIPERGTAIQLERRRALLQLTGARELKTDEQGAPQPLLIDIHPDSDFDDMTYLVRQIFHFTFMSWRTFMPAGEPVTSMYPQRIANMLARLRKIDGWNSNVLLTEPLRSSKWFL